MRFIKPLDWATRIEEETQTVVVYANPKGLKYSYNIYNENSSFVVAYIEDDGQFKDGNPLPTLELAKAEAEQHYLNIVDNFLYFSITKALVLIFKKSVHKICG